MYRPTKQELAGITAGSDDFPNGWSHYAGNMDRIIHIFKNRFGNDGPRVLNLTRVVLYEKAYPAAYDKQ